MRPPTIFETERLFLRPPILEDAETIFKLYAQDVEVTRFLTWKPHPDLETTRSVIRRQIEDWEQGTRFEWVITQSTDHQLLGMIGMRINRFESILGYVLARLYWGQGIMTEMVRTLIDWALAQPEIYRVSAICDWENLASARA